MKKTSASSATLPTENQSTPKRYSGVVVAPRYSSVSGRLRRYTLGAIQCSLFCGESMKTRANGQRKMWSFQICIHTGKRNVYMFNFYISKWPNRLRNV